MKKLFILFFLSFLCLKATAQCPTANAGPDRTTCLNTPIALSGSITVATGAVWTTSGSGRFRVADSLYTDYRPSPSDLSAGTVTITLTTTGNGACPAAQDDFVLTIIPAPVADAGPPSVCTTTGTVPLNGSVSGATGGYWLSSGTGSFAPDNTTHNASYTLSAAEMAAGTANLTFYSIWGVCASASDRITVIYDNTCGSYGTVSGRVFQDMNNNSTQDAGENNATGFPVKFTSSLRSYYVFTDSYGNYTSYLPPDNYEVSLVGTGYYVQTIPAAPGTYSVAVSNGSISTDKDFVYNVPLHDNLFVNITPVGILRPGFRSSYYVYYKNLGSATSLNTIVDLSYDTKLSNLASIGMPFTSSGPNQISWNIGTLAPEQKGLQIVTFDVDLSSVIGDVITSTASINPSANDVNTSDNTKTTSSIVGNSYDPNAKSVYAAYSASETDIDVLDTLAYTIQFQNTGTLDAINIVVKDTLDPNLDPGTFRFLGATHHCTVDIDTNNIITWSFPNIYLADSNSNEPESHGAIYYRIAQKPGNPVGTVIKNRAAIYFDNNSEILTNRTENTIVDNTVTSTASSLTTDEALTIFPNPAKESVHILSTFKTLNYAVIDLAGKIVSEGSTGELISVKNISSGIYVLRLESENRFFYRKLVIE
jgi:uncharacterized repeat protein (TIGR01451 family)